jgi:hypothetical protein
LPENKPYSVDSHNTRPGKTNGVLNSEYFLRQKAAVKTSVCCNQNEIFKEKLNICQHAAAKIFYKKRPVKNYQPFI